MSYPDFKANVLGPPAKKIGDGECVSLVVNTPQAYVENLYPGVSWPSIIPPVSSAKDMAGKSNDYLTWVANDHNNPNQVPQQGDIMVFGATPATGYTNPYNNPDGHTGVCDSASANGYALLQQNAPAFGQAANVTNYPWRFRPCLGWYHPGKQIPVPPPAPVPPAGNGNTGKDLFLLPTTGPWHLYNNNGPYSPASAKATLVPSQYGGLHYRIVEDKGNGIYIINTQMFGQGALYTKGSDIIIN